MSLRRWDAVADPVSGVTSAPAAMLVAPDLAARRAVPATMRAVVAVAALASVLRTKTVARVWGMRLSAPSAKPWSTHSKP